MVILKVKGRRESAGIPGECVLSVYLVHASILEDNRTAWRPGVVVTCTSVKEGNNQNLSEIPGNGSQEQSLDSCLLILELKPFGDECARAGKRQQRSEAMCDERLPFPSSLSAFPSHVGQARGWARFHILPWFTHPQMIHSLL